MAKITTTITLNAEIHTLAKEMFPNLSGTINELLGAAIASAQPEAKHVLSLANMSNELQSKLDKMRSEEHKLELELKRKRLESATEMILK
jgi:hypothetical protein